MLPLMQRALMAWGRASQLSTSAQTAKVETQVPRSCQAAAPHALRRAPGRLPRPPFLESANFRAVFVALKKVMVHSRRLWGALGPLQVASVVVDTSFPWSYDIFPPPFISCCLATDRCVLLRCMPLHQLLPRHSHGQARASLLHAFVSTSALPQTGARFSANQGAVVQLQEVL